MALTTRAARSAAALLDAGLRRLPFAGVSAIRFEAALVLARALRGVDRWTNERIDVSRAGRALLVAEPRAIARLAARLPHGTGVVSGTNGKTTTTNLLAEILTAAGHRPVVNRIGANMAGGVAAELLAAARLGGRMTADIGVFEVDELWLDRVLPDLHPRLVVLTNLFRDQLDRMGEVDQVADRWEEIIAELSADSELVVCADDPRLARLGDGRRSVAWFGVTATEADLPPSADIPDCRRCGAPLVIERSHIGHLGAWHCPSCGDARRTPDLVAEAIEVVGTDRVRFIAVDRSSGTPTPASAPIELTLPGRFNAANAAAAIAGARALGVPLADAAAGLSTARAAFGRAEHMDVAGRSIVLLLAKNPVGLDEVLSLLSGRPPFDLLMLLNDRDIDGRDVSWIWDGDVEAIAGSIRSATCGGTRGADAAMRLDYAGVDPDAIELIAERTGNHDTIGEALACALTRGTDELVVIANYTAMLDLREHVAEQGFAARYWA